MLEPSLSKELPIGARASSPIRITYSNLPRSHPHITSPQPSPSALLTFTFTSPHLISPHLTLTHVLLTSLQVKHDNCLQKLAVEVVGLRDRPALNGCAGVVVGIDEAKRRYHVKLPEATISLSTCNIVLPVRTFLSLQYSLHWLALECWSTQMA